MLKSTIPFVDLRNKTPIDLLRAYPDKAQELIRASTGTFGPLAKMGSVVAMPLADKRSHSWLKRNRNPYLYEIESFAEILEVSGIYALNICYEWGCTSGLYRTGETVSLLRILDWPFPELGRQVMVVRQQGKAGDFYNLTWPATSGIFTAMAPGRFTAALNQAPMRKHRMGFGGDWLMNRLLVDKAEGLPPSHLLRQVFEQAPNYEEAKRMLCQTRIAIPAIFILGGTNSGEGCIIERLENSFEVAELGARQQLTASNHFNSSIMTVGKGWRPREEDSEGRHRQSCEIHGHDLEVNHFDWLRSPMININTRLCAMSDATTCRLVVQGYEGMAPVTDVYALPSESYDRKEAM
jgi:hypothetical protein